MHGRVMSISPEETCGKAVMLMLLEAYRKSDLRIEEIDVAYLHRSAVVVANSLNSSETIRTRVRFTKVEGRFAILDKIVAEAGKAVIVSYEGEREKLALSHGFERFASTRLSRLCNMGPEERRAIESVCQKGVAHYKNLSRSCCD